MKKVKTKFGFAYEFDRTDHAQIRQALARRERQIDIAELFGVSVARLSTEIKNNKLGDGLEFVRGVAGGADIAEARKWPPDVVEFLKKRWNDGASASEISRELGEKMDYCASRSSVIGKLYRMGLGTRSPSAPRKVAAAVSSPENHGRAPSRHSCFSSPSRRAHFSGPSREGRQMNPKGVSVGPNPVNFPLVSTDAPRLAAQGDEFLAAGQQPVGCRYIEGDISPSLSDDPSKGGWRYCQRAQVEGSSYCAAHNDRAATNAGQWRRFILTSKLPADKCATAVAEKFGVEVTAAAVIRMQRAARAYRGRA